MATTRADRALEAWDALALTCLRPADGGGLAVLERPGRRKLVPVWPVSQVLAAAVDLAAMSGPYDDVERLVIGLRPYAAGDGYLPAPGTRRRYYDDNAWLGLCFAQLHLQTGEARWLRRARKVFRFVREGQDPDGGVRWVEGRRARHTCAAAPAAQLALRLHLAGDDASLAFAERTLGWLDATLRRRGLYADHVDARGRVERALWTYNQGAPIGALRLLHVATGDEGALERALATARASLARFDDDRTWRHAPAFNAVWFRNLLALDASAGRVDGVMPALDAYLTRAWRAGRDDDGLFTAGGIGTYDGTPAIDTGGLAQLFALRVWARDRRADIC